MKSFFTSFFAAILALFVFSIVGVMLLIGLGSAFSSDEPEAVASNAVLVIDLADNFTEKEVSDPFSELLNQGSGKVPSLTTVIGLIQHAKKDSNIKGIYIKCQQNSNGYASSEELRKALVEFKKSNKFIFAYGETISQKGYWVGNVANGIYTHPQGGLEFSGFSLETVFLKGMLDKLDVEMQVFYAGKFKSATEPFRYDKMSDANRQQLETFISDIWSTMCQRISVQRTVSQETLDLAASELRYFNSSKAVEDGLLNGLIYKDELELKLKERLQANWNEGNSLADESISFQDYKAELITDQLLNAGNQQVAVVYAVGAIESGKGNDQTIGSERISKAIREARENPNVKAVVLRVNSPGGSALASDVIWRETQLLKQSGKPFVVSMGDYAASGGYYIACGADRIFALPNTITGSIGVFGVIPNLQKFFENKFGNVKNVSYIT